MGGGEGKGIIGDENDSSSSDSESERIRAKRISLTMKKARKIKVKGIEYKYIALYYRDEDDDIFNRVYLYHIDGTRSWWNGVPKKVTNLMVKEAILTGKFYNDNGQFKPI